MRRLDILSICFLMTLFCYMTAGMEDLEFMESTEAIVINNRNNKETKLLKELMGSPVGDAYKAAAITNGISNRSKIRINCHHLSPGTSSKRKTLLMAICPQLRKEQYNKHAKKVAKILKNQAMSDKSLEEQKKDFLNAVTEMARAAGHLPTLELH
ncbi:uncharacterized protein LOC130622100 [Hydractinia symbiolongicarpus]|uniref:uncharacterized protein LOC130622100 n=1 Tax=Hydractinia symbiolongicarpus TaxID=13093 RepID=UPI00254C0AD0|nr:uncharacterized protein LOC130622100 [Hydractinia symbiolongicarpus]